MLSRIHFLHEILLNLLISCRKNKVSYHVFLLLLLVHEVYIENQEPRIEKSYWSIQISNALLTLFLGQAKARSYVASRVLCKRLCQSVGRRSASYVRDDRNEITRDPGTKRLLSRKERLARP